jgi:hypothetical protein
LALSLSLSLKCADISGCGACISSYSLTAFECQWCSSDNACTDADAKCAAPTECVSLDKKTACTGTSADACPAADAVPQQVHVALGNSDATAMTVQWFTGKKTAASAVQYGTSASALSESATGSARSYLDDFGWHHAATLTVKPATEYFYRAGDGTSWGETLSFVVPGVGRDTPVALSVFGDMGYKNSTVPL